MGKTSKWLRSILTGKKDKDKDKCSKATNPNSSNGADDRTTPASTTTPKEKRRWSFRRSSASSTAPASSSESNVVVSNSLTDAENEQKKQAMAVAAATAAAADAAVAAAQAAAAVIRFTAAGSNGLARSAEEAAAIKIQSVFRSYLARKALCALRGLVKLQALVRGHLVRKQATATLRCMQALVTAQARARALRIRMASEEKPNQRHSTHMKATEDNFRHSYDEMDMNLEENIKIVEMDVCETKGDLRRIRNSNGNNTTNYPHHTYYSPNALYSKEEAHRASSPSPSALTEMSPRAYSGHFEDCTSFSTAQSSPYYHSAISRPDDSKIHPFAFPKPHYAESVTSYDYPLFPNYMTNTESSRAKARSQSAPKQRPPDSFERQASRRRPSVEGRNVPRPVRMQRSASHVGASAQNYQYPRSIKLDKSSVSLKDSECGSTSTVLTNTNYCRSLVNYNPNGERYH